MKKFIFAFALITVLGLTVANAQGLVSAVSYLFAERGSVLESAQILFQADGFQVVKMTDESVNCYVARSHGLRAIGAVPPSISCVKI